MQIPSLTIGISAYNEERNIGHLISDILLQQISSAQLTQVLVLSDGSTDKTVRRTQQAFQKFTPTKPHHLKLTVKNSQQRKGLAARLNELCRTAHTDYLVILNADVRLDDPSCIDKLIHPLTQGQADLTSCNLVAFPPRTLIERVINTSMEIKTTIFEEYQHGDNVYTCHGTARGFSRLLYTQIEFPHSVGEDAYAYLYATYHHFPYQYVRTTAVRYRLPSTFVDHQKQALRFVQSKSQFVREFGELFMRKTYYLPKSLIFQATLQIAWQKPIDILVYALVMCIIRYKAKSSRLDIPNTWEIATSSK